MRTSIKTILTTVLAFSLLSTFLIGFQFGKVKANPLSYYTYLIEGGMTKPCSYLGFIDAGTYYVLNGTTGDLYTSGTNFETVAELVTNTALDPNGGKFFLTNGVYELTDSWDITSSNVTIQGEGHSTVLFSDTTTNFNIIIIGDGINQLYSVLIYDLNINGNQPEKTNDLPSATSGLIRIQDAHGVTIKGNWIHNGRACGVSSDWEDNHARITVTENIIEWFVQVTQCDSGTDIIASNYTIISDNIIRDCDNDGIWLAGSHHCIVSGNTIDVTQDLDGSGVGGWAIGLSYSGAGGDTGSGFNSVLGNTIWARDMGIYLYGDASVGNVVSGNTIRGCTAGGNKAGIKLYGDGANGYPTLNLIANNNLHCDGTAGTTGLLEVANSDQNIFHGNIVVGWATNTTIVGANSQDWDNYD